MDERAVLAVANNAAWCDAVCRARGIEGTFFRDYWIHDGDVVPLYPNLITLTPGSVDKQTAAIKTALSAAPPSRWFVKDSFNRLPLHELGFSVLLDAEWFVLPPPKPAACGGVVVDRAKTDDQLRQWEAAWGQTPPESPYGDRVFAPPLLSERRVAFLFRQDHDIIVAGLIANEAHGVVGISNWFSRSDNRQDLRACLAAASSLWPSSPLAGYTGRRELHSLRQLGAQPCGSCRVWAFSG